MGGAQSAESTGTPFVPTKILSVKVSFVTLKKVTLGNAPPCSPALLVVSPRAAAAAATRLVYEVHPGGFHRWLSCIIPLEHTSSDTPEAEHFVFLFPDPLLCSIQVRTPHDTSHVPPAGGNAANNMLIVVVFHTLQ
ncbi:unnamed protein product [Ectocarpus sp. 4 AP-2014]